MTTEPIDQSSISIFESLHPTFWKKGRLQTFKYWPFKSDKHQCNPDNMATAGFYAIGGKDEPDLAECFMCHKQLDGWEPNDDPWQEHKKHQPDCPFIQINKLDEGSLTIKELFYLAQHYYKHIKNHEFEAIMTDMRTYWKEQARTAGDVFQTLKKSAID